mmetsp:Transcript_90169/g.160600  ORF Transcript_90169/g.160600 Transcript_90169/m.160600 type:complete len:84 (+) Transcript_90169:111-362(+)
MHRKIKMGIVASVRLAAGKGLWINLGDLRMSVDGTALSTVHLDGHYMRRNIKTVAAGSVRTHNFAKAWISFGIWNLDPKASGL